MEKELGVIQEVLKYAADVDDIALVINKTLHLLEHHTQASLTGFYWHLNKNFYFYSQLTGVDEVCKELKEASSCLHFEHYASEPFIKDSTSLVGSKVAYFPVMVAKKLVGVVSVVFEAGPSIHPSSHKATTVTQGDRDKKEIPFVVSVLRSEAEQNVSNHDSLIWSLVYQLGLSVAHAASQYAVKRNKHEAISAMIAVIEALDPYTRDHAKNVANYALLLAEELKLSPQVIEEVYYGALFHDIGKVGIPVTILRKTGALTADEYELIKDHPRKGAKILEKFHEFRALVPVVLHHHEMFGGGGYPDHLVGDHIPFNARLVAVVDAYDAITTNRSYRKAQGCKTAIDLIIKNTPQQFDPEIVKAFINVEKNL